MSHYETPEQRQITELRTRIARMNLEAVRRDREAADLQREIGDVRRRQQAENARLLQQMQRERQDLQREKAGMSAALRSLNLELQEKERMQNEKIRSLREEHRGQIEGLEARFQAERQGLQEEIAGTRLEMREGLREIRQETDRKIRDQQNELGKEIASLNAKLEEEMQGVNGRVASLEREIVSREQGAKELAEYWSEEAGRLLIRLEERYRGQLFDKKRLARTKQRVEDARQDIAGGRYQSAVSIGREAFHDAMEMKEELAALELTWNYWYNAVRDREAGLLEALEQAQNRSYSVEIGGEILEYDNGIDYWTGGRLAILREKISKLRDGTTDLEGAETTALRDLERKLGGFLEELALLENAAHINVAMSLSRFETAAKIGEILDENFEMIDADGDFFGEENREEYHAIFQNPMTRDQVAVVITPVPDENGVVTNHIELLVGNADNDPVSRDRIARLVAERLREKGVEGCAFPCALRHGDRTGMELCRVGDIGAVARGEETARASLPGERIAADGIGGQVARVKAKQSAK